MDSVAVTVPLRPPTKKMKKRKELDALAPPHAVSRRSSGKRSSQELLSDSSDERSEYWNVSTRGGRKCRGRRERACPTLLKAFVAFLALASILATAILIWLFIDVRQQLNVLRTELDQVIAGNEGVPDALQKCHSLSRDLQNNQTTIFTQLSDLKLQINNFTQQLSGIEQGLHALQEWMQDTPELANVPKTVHSLKNSVASFGSQISDLLQTVKDLKKSYNTLQQDQSGLKVDVANLSSEISGLRNVTQKPLAPVSNESKIKTEKLDTAIAQLSSNLVKINETLSSTVQKALSDQIKDHNSLQSLQDTSQNISARLTSLEGECTRQTAVSTTTVKSLSDQFGEVNATNKQIVERVNNLEHSYDGLRNSTDAVKTIVLGMRNERQKQSEANTKEQTTAASAQKFSAGPTSESKLPSSSSLLKTKQRLE